jgi:hypothetical protein
MLKKICPQFIIIIPISIVTHNRLPVQVRPLCHLTSRTPTKSHCFFCQWTFPTETPYIPRAISHAYFASLRSFQRVRPRPKEGNTLVSTPCTVQLTGSRGNALHRIRLDLFKELVIKPNFLYHTLQCHRFGGVTVLLCNSDKFIAA